MAFRWENGKWERIIQSTSLYLRSVQNRNRFWFSRLPDLDGLCQFNRKKWLLRKVFRINYTCKLLYILNEKDLPKDQIDLVVCGCFSHSVWSLAIDYQAHLSLGFSRQEYWNGLPFPPPGDLPNPEIKPASPSLAGRFFTTEPPGKSR